MMHPKIWAVTINDYLLFFCHGQDLVDDSDSSGKDCEKLEETKDESAPLLAEKRTRRRSSSRGPAARRGLSSPLITQKQV